MSLTGSVTVNITAPTPLQPTPAAGATRSN
jgi:hypothetical protein